MVTELALPGETCDSSFACSVVDSVCEVLWLPTVAGTLSPRLLLADSGGGGGGRFFANIRVDSIDVVVVAVVVVLMLSPSASLCKSACQSAVGFEASESGIEAVMAALSSRSSSSSREAMSPTVATNTALPSARRPVDDANLAELGNRREADLANAVDLPFTANSSRIAATSSEL